MTTALLIEPVQERSGALPLLSKEHSSGYSVTPMLSQSVKSLLGVERVEEF